MIERLIQTDVSTFDRDSLRKLKSYFDINIITCTLEQRRQWFENLYVLAQHDLSVAHCVQHNHAARMHLEVKFKDKKLPDFYDPVYENQIGCFSNAKSADTMSLNGTTVSGTKHWISLVDLANFGIFRVPVNDTEAYVLIDFAQVKPKIETNWATPIGMKVARPGSITIDNYTLSEHYILGYRKYTENSPLFFPVGNMNDYCFITNYVGLIVALYKDIQNYIEQNKINMNFELNKIGLKVAGLVMMWQDNLASIDLLVYSSDNFWLRRNTQYVLGKEILLELISLILQTGDSRWLDAASPKNQRFRDALTFSSHMKPLQKNLEEKHFVKL